MKIKGLLYTTKAKPTLYNVLGKFITTKYMGKDFMQDGITHPELNGKIIAECDYEVEEIHFLFNEGEELKNNNGWRNYRYTIESLNYWEFYKKSCLSFGELDDYFEAPNENKKVGYAIHIKNLHIFDKPKELSECHKKYGGINYSPTYYMPISKAPQNMMKVWLYKNGEWVMYILISIQSQWMRKILNKEKDIEVRKKVLKEMV